MTVAAADSAVETTLGLLGQIFGGLDKPAIAIRLWDGTTWEPAPGTEAKCLVVLKHPGALRRMFLTPTELNLAECYLHDDYDIEGDAEALMPVGEQLVEQPRTFWDKLRVGRRLLSLPSGRGRSHNGIGRARLSGSEHSVERDSAAVTHHYNVSNHFYSLWLDRNMVYSCALFGTPDESLDAAQERKLDYICRKLRLQPGERFLDIGCGWGGLIMHAAREYGAEALGITLSQPQADLANERIREAGLQDRCRAEVVDYRQLKESGFDKLASIGMVEHVGEERLPEYFGAAFELLKPGGVFLNHGIGELPGRPRSRKPGFVRTYVFPDSGLPSISSVVTAAEECRFEPRDVESLREHYAMTLRHWVRRLEARQEEARKEVGETTYRVWRLYMAGCAHWFAAGHIAVYQTLLVKRRNGRSGFPLLRNDWYEPRSGS